jgi:hypothetical protein
MKTIIDQWLYLKNLIYKLDNDNIILIIRFGWLLNFKNSGKGYAKRSESHFT